MLRIHMELVITTGVTGMTLSGPMNHKIKILRIIHGLASTVDSNFLSVRQYKLYQPQKLVAFEIHLWKYCQISSTQVIGPTFYGEWPRLWGPTCNITSLDCIYDGIGQWRGCGSRERDGGRRKIRTSQLCRTTWVSPHYGWTVQVFDPVLLCTRPYPIKGSCILMPLSHSIHWNVHRFHLFAT